MDPTPPLRAKTGVRFGHWTEADAEEDEVLPPPMVLNPSVVREIQHTGSFRVNAQQPVLIPHSSFQQREQHSNNSSFSSRPSAPAKLGGSHHEDDDEEDARSFSGENPPANPSYSNSSQQRTTANNFERIQQEVFRTESPRRTSKRRSNSQPASERSRQNNSPSRGSQHFKGVKDDSLDHEHHQHQHQHQHQRRVSFSGEEHLGESGGGRGAHHRHSPNSNQQLTSPLSGQSNSSIHHRSTPASTPQQQHHNQHSSGGPLLIPQEIPSSATLFVLTTSEGRDKMFKTLQYLLKVAILVLNANDLFPAGAKPFTEYWSKRFATNVTTIRNGRALFKVGRWIVTLFHLATIFDRLEKRLISGKTRQKIRAALRLIKKYLPTDISLWRVLVLAMGEGPDGSSAASPPRAAVKAAESQDGGEVAGGEAPAAPRGRGELARVPSTSRMSIHHNRTFSGSSYNRGYSASPARNEGPLGTSSNGNGLRHADSTMSLHREASFGFSQSVANFNREDAGFTPSEAATPSEWYDQDESVVDLQSTPEDEFVGSEGGHVHRRDSSEEETLTFLPAAYAHANHWRKAVDQFSTILMSGLAVRSIASLTRNVVRDVMFLSKEGFLSEQLQPRALLSSTGRHRVQMLANRAWFTVSAIDLLLNSARLFNYQWIEAAVVSDSRLSCACTVLREAAQHDNKESHLHSHQQLNVKASGIPWLRKKSELFYPPLDLDFGCPSTTTPKFFEAAPPERMMVACVHCGCLCTVIANGAKREGGHEEKPESPHVWRYPSQFPSAAPSAAGSNTNKPSTSHQVSQPAPTKWKVMLLPWLLRKCYSLLWCVKHHDNLRHTLLLQLKYLCDVFLSTGYAFGDYEPNAITEERDIGQHMHSLGAVCGLTSAAVALWRVYTSH